MARCPEALLGVREITVKGVEAKLTFSLDDSNTFLPVLSPVCKCVSVSDKVLAKAPQKASLKVTLANSREKTGKQVGFVPCSE